MANIPRSSGTSYGPSNPFGLSPRFLEREYRRYALPWDRAVAAGLLVVAGVFQLVQLPFDFRLVADPQGRIVIVSARVLGAAASVACLFPILATTRLRIFDGVLLAWILVTLGGVLVGDAVVPADYEHHVAWDVLVLLVVYTVVPLSLFRQIVIGVVFSGTVFWIEASLHEMGITPAASDFGIALLCANAVGVFAAVRHHRVQREAFLARNEEIEARRGMERALAEVRTLRGIIPICSNCREVRTETGEWERVEAYIRDHSDAEFSHGLCPKCADDLYPELDDGS